MHVDWAWKSKDYPDQSQKKIGKGQGPRTKKGHKKERARIEKANTYVCPFETWKKKDYMNYMAVKLALGYTPLDSGKWYENIRREGHHLISAIIKLYWEKQGNKKTH